MNKVISKTSKKKLFCGNTQKLLIVADCSKSEHLVHFFDCITGQYLYRHPLKIQNDLVGFNFLRKKIQVVLDKKRIRTNEVDFVLEDPASYSQEFIYFLQKEGFNVLYVNAFQASKYRDNTRASSDLLDLDGIVRSALMGQSYQTREMGEVYSRIKESHRERNRLVKEENRHKNIIHSQIDQLFPGYLSKTKSGIHPFSKACVELMSCSEFGPQLFLNGSSKRVLKLIAKAGFNEPQKVQEDLAQLSAKCLDITNLEPEVYVMRLNRLHAQLKLLKMRRECIELEEQSLAELLQHTPYALLTSITGSGIITVSAIAGELGDPAKWPDADKIASYAGIVPRQKQTGGSSKPTVTSTPPKAANKYLKNALMTIVRVAKSFHSRAYKETGIIHPLKAHFDCVALRGGSSYTSTSKKLLRIMIAMLRDETIYMPDIHTTPPELYLQWLEQCSGRMIEKWQASGIDPTPENYLGKWLKTKELLSQIIHK